ncbi:MULTISPECIES: ATP-dependent DNA helicase RecG [Gardnerella]|uniref:ATP-dependent DNA helicase RecG n=1 Tax=Gardnerella TaxID=2701 RepID=UPI000941D7FA|nr:ATP-dependent DNA helicase RecG [Gardnerella vaginalis]AYZ22256.1 ATP-dependent DNA helicase RecG [Gardnerella vaginalis]OKY55244.1 ATP-dependent DNA helicase RecG [Gardnerella vaginalis]PNL26383.1 ATP-dependent DNA helicase RecG [Gardnerella vaginalis]PTE03401.1 ATP-dependent DNA helicase RecG [Gardnerella vaginalis]
MAARITLNTAISSIVSNKRRASALKSLGVITVKDALTYYPFRVTNPLKRAHLSQILPGQEVAFSATIQSINIVQMAARRGYRLEVNVAQDAAQAQIVYFSKNRQYVQWVSGRIAVGQTVVVGGTSGEFNGRLQFTHPQILTVRAKSAESDDSAYNTDVRVQNSDDFSVQSVEDGIEKLCAPQPIYHANSRISSEHIHETILGLLRLFKTCDSSDFNVDTTGVADTNVPDTNVLSDVLPDVLPQFVTNSRNLMHRAAAFESIHNPQNKNDFENAIHTMRYEEAFISQIAVLQSRKKSGENKAYTCENSELRKHFEESLPFELTEGQKNVISEITADMQGESQATEESPLKPMRRLLQGEVGSGKTIVAMSAMLQAVGSGHQAVLIAPTQVLASQHATNLQQMIERAGINVEITLITGGMKLASRRSALAKVASGEPAIIVATHAAFSASFKPTNLALVIIDEQHRFGVEQRDTLLRKISGNAVPHLLVMTATPIPRSAAMTWFGDLDASYLTELPGGRKPIRTFVINEEDSHKMASMFYHIRSRIDAGERAYVVCARIDSEDSEENNDNTYNNADAIYQENQDSYTLNSQNTQNTQIAQREVHTVLQISKRLQNLPQFKGVEFAQLTGRTSDEEKREIMHKFDSGQVQILVSTTVIEVGVDVAKASCIVIFDADRFGLAQLHQLRGRVGRSGTQSWAFLVSNAPNNQLAAERLQVVENSLDGAIIAQKDLELRNVGDVLGDSQSGGKSSLKLLRVVKDAKIIAEAREDANTLLEHDPTLLEHPQTAGAVLDFTQGSSTAILSN